MGTDQESPVQFEGHELGGPQTEPKLKPQAQNPVISILSDF